MYMYIIRSQQSELRPRLHAHIRTNKALTYPDKAFTRKQLWMETGEEISGYFDEHFR